jgi:hypothetical protein
MNHETMDNCLLIAGNQNVWNTDEKEEILDKAVDKYMKKRQTTRISAESNPPPAKSTRIEVEVLSSSSDDDSQESNEVTTSSDEDFYLNDANDNE